MPSRQNSGGNIRRFASFEANLETRELRKGGMRLRLQEQPFQVLAMLLERPGELVGREDLRQKLWPADTFVDFDQGLNTAINRLREVLGDSAGNPKFVETLPKRGYRFIFPVDGLATEGESQSGKAAANANLNPAAALDSTAGAMPDAHGGDELPRPAPGVARLFFLLAQALCLTCYIAMLANLHAVAPAAERIFGWGSAIARVALVTALVGIAVRLYLASAAAFHYRYLANKFERIFPGIFCLDELWALAPLLLGHRIGYGLALAGVAALVWLPFAQRTLLRMAQRR